MRSIGANAARANGGKHRHLVDMGKMIGNPVHQLVRMVAEFFHRHVPKKRDAG
jgi:hypothetical protein